MKDTSQKPTSINFITPFAQELIDKIKSQGWDIDKTLFLEIPFHFKSAGGIYFIKDYRNRVFYKTFIISRGVVKGLSDSELNVFIEHEKWEMDQAIKEINSGSWSPKTEDEERKRHEPEAQRLNQLFGEGLWQKTRAKASEIASKNKYILKDLCLYWIVMYALIKNEGLKGYAFKITKEMYSPEHRTHLFDLISRFEKGHYIPKIPTEHWLLKSALAKTTKMSYKDWIK